LQKRRAYIESAGGPLSEGRGGRIFEGEKVASFLDTGVIDLEGLRDRKSSSFIKEKKRKGGGRSRECCLAFSLEERSSSKVFFFGIPP